MLVTKMHSIECIEYCTKDQSNVEDVDRSIRAVVCMSKTSKNTNVYDYNVDSNTKYSNYIEFE